VNENPESQESIEPIEVEVEGELDPETDNVVEIKTDADLPADIREQAEQKIRQVQVAKLRGQATIAEKLLKEAEEFAPEFSLVQEAIGDDLVARSQFRRAKEVYLKAHNLDPANKEIENKYGEMVLKVDLFIDPMLMSQADVGTMASGKAAVVLNLLFPGVGHMVLGKYVFGTILLVVWVGCMLIAFGTPGGIPALLGSLGIGSNKNPVPPLVPVALFGIVVCWLTGILSAAGASKSMTPKVVERPSPLSHHKFD